MIEVDNRQIPVRAVFTGSERVKAAVDGAYAEKFNTKGSLHFVEGSRRRRDAIRQRSSVPVSCVWGLIK